MSTLPPRLPVLTRRGSIVLRVLALLLVPVVVGALLALLVAGDLEGAVRSGAVVLGAG